MDNQFNAMSRQIVDGCSKATSNGFGDLDEWLDSIDKRLNSLEKRLDLLDERWSTLDNGLVAFDRQKARRVRRIDRG